MDLALLVRERRLHSSSKVTMTSAYGNLRRASTIQRELTTPTPQWTALTNRKQPRRRHPWTSTRAPSRRPRPSHYGTNLTINIATSSWPAVRMPACSLPHRLKPAPGPGNLVVGGELTSSP